jgi:hypothetical protein
MFKTIFSVLLPIVVTVFLCKHSNVSYTQHSILNKIVSDSCILFKDSTLPFVLNISQKTIGKDSSYLVFFFKNKSNKDTIYLNTALSFEINNDTIRLPIAYSYSCLEHQEIDVISPLDSLTLQTNLLSNSLFIKNITFESITNITKWKSAAAGHYSYCNKTLNFPFDTNPDSSKTVISINNIGYFNNKTKPFLSIKKSKYLHKKKL